VQHPDDDDDVLEEHLLAGLNDPEEVVKKRVPTMDVGLEIVKVARDDLFTKLLELATNYGMHREPPGDAVVSEVEVAAVENVEALILLIRTRPCPASHAG
jgi:hypothetical protein